MNYHNKYNSNRKKVLLMRTAKKNHPHQEGYTIFCALLDLGKPRLETILYPAFCKFYFDRSL